MNVIRPLAGVAGILVAGLALAGGRVAIVSEGGFADRWAPAPDQPRVVAGYPSTAADKTRDVCVNIGYMIGPDGSTSQFTEMKSWTSGQPQDAMPDEKQMEPYVQIAAAVVSRWKYVPVGKPKPVFTSATFAFDGSKSLSEEGIRSRCFIGDLQDYVAQMQSKDQERGNLDKMREQRRRDMQEQAMRPTGAPGRVY